MIIIFSDPHVTESSINELEGIFTGIVRKYAASKNLLLCAGDFFDKKRPTPLEIKFGAKWAKRFNIQFKKFVMLTGNHPTIDDTITSVDYLYYIDTIIRKSIIIEEVYIGHHFINGSSKAFNEPVVPLEIRKYRYVLLGHQHQPQKINDNSYHIGSCRFTTFGELDSEPKRVAVIDGEDLKWELLTEVIPIKEVFSVEELKKVDKNTKVRITYTDFNKFKEEVSELTILKKDFIQYKLRLDFPPPTTTSLPPNPLSGGRNFLSLINRWIDTIEDKEIKELIKDEFKEDYS